MPSRGQQAAMQITDTDAPDIHDPEPPLSEQPPVEVSVPEGVTEGITTMAGLFGQPQVVDEVRETPVQAPVEAEWWVIRPSDDVEDMTVGLATMHFAFKAGVRYRVPLRVAQILAEREKLLEMPFPYDDRYARR